MRRRPLRTRPSSSKTLFNVHSMASPAISARLKYLNDSAHLLVTSAPGTSAYLMSRCNGLMFDNGLDQSDAHKRHVCGACGNIMILGWTGTRQLESLKAQKGRRNARSTIQQSSSEKVKTVVYTCQRCGRRTRQSINTNIPRPSKTLDTTYLSKASQIATPLRAPSSETHSGTRTPSSASANASSRKRAKIRKQGGLQALLAKNRENDTRGSTGGFGLDLLDLMKKA
jgi:ribonuclease MRP protein subunit SNM1